MAVQYENDPNYIPVQTTPRFGEVGKVYYNKQTKSFVEFSSTLNPIDNSLITTPVEIKKGDPRWANLWKKHQKDIQNFINIQNGGIENEDLFEPSLGTSTLGPSSGAKGKTLTYPKEKVEDDSYFTSKDTDYVIFEFGE